MIFPNKITPFQNSIISKVVYILDELSIESLEVLVLYNKVSKHFEDLDQFILTLDVLFLLEKIEFDEKWEVLKRVKNDIL